MLQLRHDQAYQAQCAGQTGESAALLGATDANVASMGGRNAAALSSGRFLGWRMVAIASLSQGTALAMTLSVYSLAKPYLREEFELTDLEASRALVLVLVYTTLFAPVIGRLADAGHVRRLMAGGAVLMGFGMVTVRTLHEPTLLILVYVLMIGTAEAMMGVVPSGTLISKWFAKRVALALGAAMIGVTLLQLSAERLDHAMEMIGWRGVAGILGFFAVVVLLPAAWFGVVERPDLVGQLPDGRPPESEREDRTERPQPIATSSTRLELREILGTREFWLISQGCILLIALLVMLNLHSGQHTKDLALGTGAAGRVLQTLALGSLFGISLGAILGDRVPLKPLFGVPIGLQAVSWIWLTTAATTGELVVGAFGISLATGFVVPMRGRAIREIFGEANFGRVLGLMLCATLPLMISVLLGSAAIRDASGSYVPAFKLALAANALSLLLLGMTRFSHRVVPNTEVALKTGNEASP